MTKKTWIFSQKLIASSLLVISWIAPTLAQQPRENNSPRVDIYNFEKRVVFHTPRIKNCEEEGNWCRLTSTGQDLQPGDWLKTHKNAMAKLSILPQHALYNQGQNSTSKFSPEKERCGFLIDQGGGLAMHDSNSPTKSCKIETSEVELKPTGTALFVWRRKQAQETIVGVLSDGPITVINNQNGNTIELGNGEVAVVSADGGLQRGEFSLRRFYEDNRIALGLGCGERHEAYVNQQSTEIRELLSKIRQETCEASRAQDESGLSELTTVIDLPTFTAPVDDGFPFPAFGGV
ncbi:MAG: hypothetical protein F6J96_13825 [Symploca sp. SIO1C2]|nr:hypothetical protein [Symploca sp. SIO1C2]